MKLDQSKIRARTNADFNTRDEEIEKMAEEYAEGKILNKEFTPTETKFYKSWAVEDYKAGFKKAMEQVDKAWPSNEEIKKYLELEVNAEAEKIAVTIWRMASEWLKATLKERLSK